MTPGMTSSLANTTSKIPVSALSTSKPSGQSGATAGGIAGAAAQGLGMMSGIVDSSAKVNQYGRRSTGANIGSNLGKYAAMGASLGSVVGPWGTVIGAAAGATFGTIKGLVDSKKQKRVESYMKMNDMLRARQDSMEMYKNMAANDSSSVFGNKMGSFFAYGGKMGTTPVPGGELKSLSSDSKEVIGPSHEAGGVMVDAGTEVEGGETIKGDYVFSERLGFAQLHKPVAKAIGRLESKPKTPAVQASLDRLKKKEQSLMLVQEVLKRKMNLQ